MLCLLYYYLSVCLFIFSHGCMALSVCFYLWVSLSLWYLSSPLLTSKVYVNFNPMLVWQCLNISLERKIQKGASDPRKLKSVIFIDSNVKLIILGQHLYLSFLNISFVPVVNRSFFFWDENTQLSPVHLDFDFCRYIVGSTNSFE